MIFLRSQTETEFALDGPNSEGGRRIDVGHRNYWLLFLVGAALTFTLFLFLIVVWLAAPIPAIVPVVFGVVLTTAGTASIVYVRWKRRSIDVLPEGFRVIDRLGTHEYRDTEVSGIAHAEHGESFLDHWKILKRTVILTVEHNWTGRRIALETSVRIGRDDPLADFINRVKSNLLDRLRNDFLSGKAVEGPDWILQRGRLQLGAQAGGDMIDLDEIAYVETVDDWLCLWMQEDVGPSRKLRADAENAWLLEHLLAEHVDARTAETSDDNSAGLGRMVFERPTAAGLAFGFYTTATVTALSGAGFLIIGTIGNNPPPTTMFGIVAIVFALPLVLLGRFFDRKTFRRHEFGISKGGVKKRRELRFREIETFSFQVVKQTVNGIPVGRHLVLTFSGESEAVSMTITHRSQHKGAPDVQLGRLRDRTAAEIAVGMAGLLAVQNTVEWTGNLSIQPEGLQYTTKRLLVLTAQPKFIPFKSITQYLVEGDRFYVWTDYQERAIVNESTAEPNFFAGLVLFESLLSSFD